MLEFILDCMFSIFVIPFILIILVINIIFTLIEFIVDKITGGR